MALTEQTHVTLRTLKNIGKYSYVHQFRFHSAHLLLKHSDLLRVPRLLALQLRDQLRVDVREDSPVNDNDAFEQAVEPGSGHEYSALAPGTSRTLTRYRS